MKLVEMSTEERVLIRDFANTIRFNMQPFRPTDFVVEVSKVGFDDTSFYKLQIQFKGGDLVFTHQISEDALMSVYSTETLAWVLAKEFAKKFHEYYQPPEDNVILGEN